jgi:hypothetical protein
LKPPSFIYAASRAEEPDLGQCRIARGQIGAVRR